MSQINKLKYAKSFTGICYFLRGEMCEAQMICPLFLKGVLQTEDSSDSQMHGGLSELQRMGLLPCDCIPKPLVRFNFWLMRPSDMMSQKECTTMVFSSVCGQLGSLRSTLCERVRELVTKS